MILLLRRRFKVSKLNGKFYYNGNTGSPTAASLTAYNNLIGKGWTITGNIPA